MPDSGPPVESRNLLPEVRAVEFYERILERLIALNIPFLVGGAFAFQKHTRVERHTRDFDVFVLPDDAMRILGQFESDGYTTCLTFPHWLGKIKEEDGYVVDVIFSSGNGIARVDPVWFEYAIPGQVLNMDVRFCPVEEMIWSKSFVMERERFDGSDVIHLIHAAAEHLDWDRLLARFGRHYRVLLAHLILFGFVYPQERDRIPARVLHELLGKLEEPHVMGEDERACLGTLLSRSQYQPDLDWGYKDGRRPPYGTMSLADIKRWTDAAEVPEAHGA